MKQIKGIYDFSWAHFVYENIEKTMDELEGVIKEHRDELKHLENHQVGRHNCLEEIYILKVLVEYKKSIENH